MIVVISVLAQKNVDEARRRGWSGFFADYGSFTVAGERHWSPLSYREVGYSRSMGKLVRTTPEGRTGILRKVEVDDRQDTEFLIKLDDGQIASIPASKLVPANFADHRRSN